MNDRSNPAGPALRRGFLPPALALLGLLLAGPALAEVAVRIDGVDGELRDNIRLRLSIVQAERHGATEQALVEALHQRAPAEIRAALQPYGYYEPQVEGELSGAAPDWTVRYVVTAGPRTVFAEPEIVVEGEGAEALAGTEQRMRRRLVAGEPLSHPDYEEAKALLPSAAYARGYLDAQFRRAELRVDPVARTAVPVLHFDTGPRYYFGTVTIEQEGLRPELLARYAGIRVGDPYDPQVLLDTEFAYSDLDYFDRVEIEPLRDQAVERRVPIRIRMTPRLPQRWQVGAGYGTDTGARVTAGLELRRLNDRGHKFRLDTRLSEVKNTLKGEYRIPQGRKPRENLSLSGELRYERYPGGVSRSWETTLALSRMPGKWARRYYLSYLHEDSELAGAVQTSDLVMPGLGLSREDFDDPIYARNGWSFYGDLHGAHNDLGSSASFLRGEATVRGAYPLPRRSRLLGRVQLGANVSDEFAELPASQRFFAGGDQSVRGYDYKSLGPRDPEGRILGGSYLQSASLEAEVMVWKAWGAALFYDIGGVGNDPAPKMFQGVGTGLRYRAPVGALQLDVAWPLDAPTDDNGVRIHVGVRVGL